MTALEFLLQWHKRYPFHSVEKPHILASNSEIRRWFNNKAVVMNGVPAKWDDDMKIYEYEDENDVYWLESLVLFPSGRRKTTLW